MDQNLISNHSSPKRSIAEGKIKKECGICGILFYTENKNRKYCEDCSAHREARKREYERAYERVRARTYEPKLIHCNCSQCGREFKLPKRLIVFQTNYKTHERLPFCSKRCRRAWLHDNNLCDQCGRPLTGDLIGIQSLPWASFCSESCRRAFMRRERIKEGGGD